MNKSSSTPDLERENSLTNLSQISLLDERTETASMSLMTNHDFNALLKKIDELTLKQIKADKNIEELEKYQELTFELKQLKEGKRVCFEFVENKWKDIHPNYPCCEKECVNTDNPDVFCMNGNGFIQIKSDNTTIKYVNCREERGDNLYAVIRAENSFNKQNENFELSQCCLNCTPYSLFYYEVKLQFEKDETIIIGLSNVHNIACLYQKSDIVCHFIQTNVKYIYLPSFSIKNNDIIGFGLVYPPLKINDKLPYVFFTQNGKQIGKAILLKENFEYFIPCLELECCSIETNFGNDLKSKPFLYNISKHYVAEEFYEDEEIYKCGW